MKGRKSLTERTSLGEMILKHWREHYPQMVLELERQNLLQRTLAETQDRTGDLLYELVSVSKMDYHAAWEMATEEWALQGTSQPAPPSENPQKSGLSKPPLKGRRGQRATSASARNTGSDGAA